MRLNKLAVMLSVVLLASASDAGVSLDTEAGGEVEALVKGPAGLNIAAKSSSLVVDDSGDTLIVSVSSTSFKSGISLRDDHMRKAIDAERFSDVKLVLQDSSLKRPGVDDTTAGDVTGDLTFHGVTKKIVVHYDAVRDCDGHIGVAAKININMRDFDVEPPSYFGVAVKPNLSVTAKMRLTTTD